MRNYKLNIVEENSCKLLLDFEIPQEEVVSETEKVYSEIQKVAKVPGFRAGKVPAETVRERYASAARDKVIENLLRDTIYPTLKEKNVNPVGSPRVEKFEFDFNKPFKFNVIVEQHPKIKAKNYRGMKLKKEIKKIKEPDINKALSELQKYNTKLVESKSETVNKEHSINVNYGIWDNGKEIVELKAENQLIDLSSQYLLPGIGENIIGTRKGDEKEIVTRLPDDFPKKTYAGKEVVIKLKVLSIKEKLLPQLDDEFAKDLGCNNLDELRKKIVVSLENENIKISDEKIEKQIVDNLLNANKISFLPNTLVEEQKQYLISEVEQKYKMQGFAQEFIDKQKEPLQTKCQQEAEKQIRLMYIFNSIAEQENIIVTDEEINQRKEELIKSNPGRKEAIQKQFSNKEILYKLTSRLKTDRIFKFIIDNAKLKTVNV